MNNRFFVIEGPEGSYKSTVVRKVTEKLKALNHDVVSSREPGGVEVAEKIRDIVVNDDMHITTEVLLFLSSRVEHYDKVIKPNLEAGRIVILDRFIYSSLSIQGAARGYDIDVIKKLHDLVLPAELDFTTFYININPEVSVPRKKGDSVQKFEKEEMKFHIKAHDFMKTACLDNKHPVVSVNGCRSSTEIADEIVNHIINKIN